MPDQQFWQSRWDANHIGFHQSQINPFLAEFVTRLPQPTPDTPHPLVLVPYCGKTLDLLFLAGKGYRVVGIEFVEKACRDFFTENNLTYTASSTPSGRTFFHNTDGSITLVPGDYFSFSWEHAPDAPWLAGSADAVYDRAALIANEPEARARYAAHTLSLLPPPTHPVAASILLIFCTYDQSVMSGPPFSVPLSEVETSYGKEGGCKVEVVKVSEPYEFMKGVKYVETVVVCTRGGKA
ncbi:Thiopurine S-methyltransferase [Gonapodya prolifera JEL478]|uniref:thiopurine S-methyltransferase n=1 Tax=Gonapodya prolifera (strain JEL478) TaxID=1344416 RepID=A0A138ZX24_GONPJ|nr:Thiopurine S-methyltransferase [Gonapodya prolifera JEL478]|eukprot:KXS09069.1 Thiopurine S-methyltransferase [Gonapodya prolifera JEL478]